MTSLLPKTILNPHQSQQKKAPGHTNQVHHDDLQLIVHLDILAIVRQDNSSPEIVPWGEHLAVILNHPYKAHGWLLALPLPLDSPRDKGDSQRRMRRPERIRSAFDARSCRNEPASFRYILSDTSILCA
jgi:hypothetical protein